MTVTFREARRDDVPAIVALLRDDALGHAREGHSIDRYLAAFDAMQLEGGNTILVGEAASGRVVATCQLTFIHGLSLRAARRAQIESVRVAADQRGTGIGRALLAEAERRAREANCALLQLTMNATRTGSHRFYEAMGYEPSHVGFKKPLAQS